ncbi:MAG: phospholipid carrier-dependent glycosyltransferase [Gemmatimonadota bacterium]|nr:phospholipid carrier-dependent glycosyltransferase [Gemmatimonadota bacterium]
MQRPTWPILLLLGAAAVLRFAALGHFPDLNADEGRWTNSTKNFLLVRDRFMDGRLHLFLSPAFHGLSLAAFAVFDASIVTARALSALLGTLSIALLFLTVRELTDDLEIATAASVLFGFSRFALYLSRSALFESTTSFFILAAAYLCLVCCPPKPLGMLSSQTSTKIRRAPLSTRYRASG